MLMTFSNIFFFSFEGGGSGEQIGGEKKKKNPAASNNVFLEKVLYPCVTLLLTPLPWASSL